MRGEAEFLHDKTDPYFYGEKCDKIQIKVISLHALCGNKVAVCYESWQGTLAVGVDSRGLYAQ